MDLAYAMLAEELGSVNALEKRFDELWQKSEEGQEELRETWGLTEEAVAAARAAEQMFGG